MKPDACGLPWAILDRAVNCNLGEGHAVLSCCLLMSKLFITDFEC